MDAINQYVESLPANGWITLGAFAITLVGIPLAIFLHYRGKKDRLPRYAIRNNSIIVGHKEKYPAVQVHFQGYGEDNIPNLSVSKVAFWNDGRGTIKKDNVTKSGVTLQMKEECVILDVLIIQSTNKENRFSITKSDHRKSATITFEYIDYCDGVVFQVFHTGTSDKDLSIVGTVMEAGEPLRIRIIPADYPQQKWFGVIAILIPIVITLATCMILSTSEHDPARQEIPTWLGYTMLIIIHVIVYVWSGMVAYVTFRRRVPKQLAKPFFDDF
jgi:hypothetical protein